MGLNGKQLLENFKEDEAYGNTTYTPPANDDDSDTQTGLLDGLLGKVGAAADWVNNNIEYVEKSPVGQWVGNNVEWLESTPVGQALAPSNSVIKNLPALLGLAINASVTPKDDDTFGGSAYNALANGEANVIGTMADFLHQDDLAASMRALANKTQDDTPVAPGLDWDYISSPHGLTRSTFNAVGSMIPTLPSVFLAPESLVAAAGRISPWLANGARFGMTAIPEAMSEGGQTRREAIEDGLDHPDLRAIGTAAKNLPLLAVSNTLEGAVLGGGLGKALAGKAGESVLARMAKAPLRATPSALVEGLQNGLEEGLQQGIQDSSLDKEHGWLPWNWNDEQWQNAAEGFWGTLPLGAIGGARKAVFPGNVSSGGSAAADSLLDQAQDDIDSITSQTAQQSVIQSAQQDMENNPYTAPTAMQDTSYEAPSDTSDTSSGSSYDASALEGDPQYTVSGEVSSTDVTPLTDQKMRLLDAAYYNKYGQHLFVTSMKRNGDGGSWHDSGQAFDTADDNLENNKEARDWLISEGEKLGLTPLDEYEHPSAGATGGHIHFSDHGEPIPDGIRVGESDSDMDDSDMDDSTGGVDLSNLPVGDIAMAIAQNTNLPVNFIWSQLSHESDGGKSKLAVEDHNYGGVKGTDGNYLHFDNDQQFIDYMSKYYPKYREDGIYDAKTADQFAEALQHGGYFTADLGEYEGGMHRYLEQAGLSQDAMFGGKARRAGRKGGDSTSSTPDLSGSFEISADDPAMDSMFASFAKDWQNMSTDASEINFFGDMFNSRNKFKATEENKQAILDNYGDAFRQYVQENQPQTVQAAQTAQAPAQPKQASQPQHIEVHTPNLDSEQAKEAQMHAALAPKIFKPIDLAPFKGNPAGALGYLDELRQVADNFNYNKDYILSINEQMHKIGTALGVPTDDSAAIYDALNNDQRDSYNYEFMSHRRDTLQAIHDYPIHPQQKQQVGEYIHMLDEEIARLQGKAAQAPAVQQTGAQAAPQSTPQAPAQKVHIATATPKQENPLFSIPDSAIAAAKQADDGFSAPLNIFSADEQKALRNAGLVYDDANYNGTERVKVDPLYEEGDRRMKSGKAKVKAETKKAGKVDKYKKDAEKIYLRFKSGKFSADDSVNQLENLKKKATSDKALSEEEKAEVVAEADNQIHRIKPQKETKEHETQKYSSKTAETAQGGKAEGYPHQDAEPEPRKAADTQHEAEEGKVSPAQNARGEAGRKAVEQLHELYPHAVKGVHKAVEDFRSGKVASVEKAHDNIDKAARKFLKTVGDVPMFTNAFKEVSRDGSVYHKFQDEYIKAHREVNAIYEARKQSAEPKSNKVINRNQDSGNKKAADDGGRVVVTEKEQKEGTNNLDSAKVPGGLSKEAQGVYIAVRDKLRTSKSERARRAADVSAEILARHADTYAKAYSKATGKQYTATDYMRDKIGIDTDGNIVNDEKAKQFFQKAWHGSPHDFDRFDLGAIGTGEGAQVHGWGLYFAANREVSEGYIERLSDVIGHEIAKDGSIVQKSDEEWVTIDNAPIDENTPPLVIALKLLREVRAKGNYNIGDAIQKLQWQYIQRIEDDIVASDFLTKWYKKFKYRNTLKNLKAAEQILKEGKYDFKNITSGHLFEVEIPEADTMLDEQLSYSEQPKMVQKAIDALYADRKKLAKEWKNLSAEDFKEIYHPSGEAWTYFMEWNRLRSLNWAFNAFTREDIGNFLRETSSKNHYPESKIREIENSEQAYNKARNDVRHALANTESYLSKMVERVGVSEDYYDMNGREIYQDYMNALMMYHNISRGLASKNTALALRKHGVNGVSYVGGRDGRCYVTFDDKTVKIINKYNQMLNGAAQGYTSALSDGKRVVTLLDGADESTFLHEMGHVFLLDLQDLAEIDQTSANDMAAVENWAMWKKGQARDYKGTAWEREFADREKAIAKAMADGDEATASQLKDEWMQERFARGFERYLESGEAPSSKLKSVFEKFKQFLTRIYNAFKGAGGKPSEDVKNVMARMMDSDVENTIKVPAMGEPIHGIKGTETTVVTDSGKEIRTQEEYDTTSDIQNANAASTEDRSVETNPRVLSYKRKAQEIVSSFEKRKVNLTDARQEIKDLMAKANEERWGQKMSNDECMAAQGFLSDALSKLNTKQAKKRKARKSIAKAKAEEKSNESIFGSVEDADKEMLDALGLSEEDLADDVLTAPSGIKNTAEEREKLEKELAAELNKLSANPVFNPKIYTLGLKLAMTYVKDGINTVKKLVAKLNATFGDKIGPWAPALAETVRTWPKGVPFDEKKVMAISKAVGARYEGGITTLDDMQADMKKLLKGQHKTFAPMIEASYNGIKKFFDEKEAQSHGDESRQEKSESTDAGREGQQSATAEGAGAGRTESRNVSGAEGGESKISRGRDSGSAERENPERTEPSGIRAGTELEETAGNGTRKRGTEKPVLTEAQKNPSPEETPGHDYEIKPSKTKKTPAVRFKQNIAAIKLLKQLEAENRMPTPKEQAILGNYNGWGGLKDAFLDTKENKELRAVLTPEEYEAAKSTINDAFYTPADIVQAVWKGVSRLGFNGGRVLDPSMGTGNFFGCMPRDMMKKSSLRGIEIDDLTSRCARMLYPSALVEHTGFEKASLADNFYDLVISNIPFDANHSIAGYKIHNYFFAHGMDKVRPGGLMVYITSQGSLTNSQDGARMREYIGKKADMIAAYKLPSGAFGESGTNVGTDIVIFRKRGENEMKPSYAQDFQHLTKMFTQTNWRGDTYGGVTVNKYFKDHPENIIGKASSGRDQYGNDVMQVKPNEGANIAKDLTKAMNKLPKDIYKPINRTGKGPFDTIKANFKARADEKTRDFEYYEKDGKVYQNQDGTAVEIGAGNKLKRLKGYLKVKNALNSLMLAEMDPNAKEPTVDKLRKQLNTAYDAFVKQNGYLNDPTVQRAYIDDPSAGMVMALEKVEYTGIGAKKKIKSVEKMGIFKERAIAPIQEVKSVKTPNDALIVSLRNKGGVDLPYMAQLMGSNPETVVAGLEGQIFKNPVTEAYETRDEYLSGNVREKLAQAENAAAQDPSYQRNVDELKKVIPKDLIADEICVTMGAPWIPASDVQAFADRITGRAGTLSIKFIPSGAKWIVDGYGSNSKYKTQGISLANLLSDILNNKAIEVYSGKGKERRLDQAATDAANVVAADMKEDFTSWLWSDKDRTKRLTSYYNDNYNNTVLREYDGSHLVFDGMNEKIQLRPHQKNVVWRMLQGGNTLIAHCVGAGKTFEMQAAGMEMRRLGIANKPLYILPNNVVEQFTKEFRQLYPDAKLLVLQNDYKSRPGYIPAVPKSTVEQTIKREDGRKETITIPFGKLSAADRKKVLEARAMRTRTLTHIRTGDWDGIIMSHSQFERLPLSPETAGSIIREQLDEVEQAIVEAKNGNVGKKDLSTIENQKKKLEDKLKDILKTDLRDIGIPFEQLGVDQIFVDEADMFKNLHYTTSMDRVNGLPNSNANRSMDMYAKTRWLTNANNGRGVVFATGTPVSNTMAEMYTMMRYLDFRGLKEKGLNLFDNWLRTFGEIGSGIERNPSGNGFRKVTKVLRFINMPELTKMFRKFADVKTQDDLDLDIPDLKNGKPTIVKIAPDPVLTDYIRNVVPKRIAAMAKRREDMHKGSDNMLKLTGDLRKMSITDSKIDALADAVAEKYEDTSDVKGAQLIFCDQGIPKAEKDNATDNLVEEDDKDAEADNAGVYKKIITALQERGIPENQIVFIQSAKNKAQMDAIFEKVDKGDIRILIGSTQKMGAGTNCQHHLVSLHDLDAPWRPRDLEQRHGRILRQGNPNKEVEIFNYVLQDSFDAVMWEKLKNKAAIVAQAMSNNMQQRTVEDADLVTLTYADAENAGTSDPLVKERITLDSEIKKYKHAQVAFNRKVSTAEATLETAPKEIGLLKSAIEKIKGDIAARQDTSGDNFRMTISGKEYVERKAAQEELGKVLARLSSKTSVKIGEIGGFDVKAYVSGDGEAHIQLVRGRAYMANTATVRGVESALHKAPETMLKAREIELSRNENNLKEAKEIVGQKNPYAEKLATMEKRFKEINRQIEDNLLGNAKKEETEAPNEETSYSAEEESGAQERALSDIKQEVASAFPNAKNVHDNGHEVLFSMPNGAEVSVSIVTSIEVTESEERNARAAHGLAPEVHVKINGKERTVGSKAIIELSQLGRKGTAYHEAFHAVYDMCLTDKEKAALHKAYDKEAKERDVYEVMADKYRDWMIAKQKGQHTLYGKLWQKVKDAAARLARVVRGADNAGDVFRKVASGEAWERPYNEVESDTRYAAEQKGAQSFIKAAASKLGKRMGVKSDKIITEEAKAKEGIGILDYLIASPSRVATRVKSFRQFYRMGVRAMDVLTERRSYYQRKLGKAMQLVKSKNDYEELTDILLSGDAEGKEWTKEELIQSGTKENVAEAYTRIRRLMRQAYKMVNEAHKHPKTYSKRLSNSKIEELRQNPFVKIMKIHDEEDDGRRLVTYREFANYEHTLEGVTKQALDGMRVDEDMQVLEATKQADGTYKVRVREGRGDVTNRKGYIPHFFHNYMVEVRDEDGNYVTTITSGRTQREAVKKAEEWMKDNKLEDGQKIYIHPKIFDFTRYGMSEKGIVQLGDKDFYALMNRVAKDNDMSLEEAKDLLQNVHQKNRHRFFGNVLHRKGVSGFETDMNYVLNHYFNSASRYYAMETEFKPQAISLYERLFGDFAKDSKNSLAQYVKDYINDVNGTPSALERGVNDALMRSKVYRDFVVSHYGERAVLQLSSNIAGATTYMCLGYFNVSSALLNLTQVMNSAAYIGDVSALGKCLSKGMHRKYSLHDLKVLKETNVLNDIGLDSGSGYDVNRMSAKSLLGKINKAGMSFFKVSEQTVRIGTVLAAYESGIKRGMSHEEAIDFAKEVNQKSNFNYSVADAPNIFRRGSFLSQLALQFKKYGIKELEVMADMCSPRTSRKQKLIFWGTYLLAAGLCGLPALDWLDEVLGWVFGKSPKLAAQEAIMEATGGTPVGKFIGRMAMYGLPSSLVGVDLSSRVGLSDVVPTELKNFLPPLATKIPQFMQDIFSEAKINAVRDFSPAIYNQIAAWGTGKSYDKRGRINAEYNTFYDKLLRSIGFKSTDERVDSDIRRITSERRSELNAEKQKAVDAYIAHPTPQNMQKLKDLGIKDSTVEKERERKKEDSYNRTKGGMTKKEAQENQQLLNFK